MKLSKRDAKLLLILLGLVVFLLSYLLIYNRYTAKSDELDAQIAQMRPQLATLEDYNKNLNSYEAGIAEAKVSTAEAMKQYPTQILPENAILYADELEKKVGITASELSFAEPVLVSEFNGVTQSGQNDVSVTMDAYETTMTMSCDLSYAQLKNLLTYVYQSPLCCGVPAFSVSYDASKAALTGTVSVAQYSISYENAESSRGVMPFVPQGQTNLFG
jgi:hypothetical protein